MPSSTEDEAAVSDGAPRQKKVLREPDFIYENENISEYATCLHLYQVAGSVCCTMYQYIIIYRLIEYLIKMKLCTIDL